MLNDASESLQWHELRWITMSRLLHLANSVSFLPMSCSLMLLNKIIKSIVHTKYHDYNFYKSCNFCFIGKNTCQLLWISWLFMWYSIRHTFTPLCWATHINGLPWIQEAGLRICLWGWFELFVMSKQPQGSSWACIHSSCWYTSFTRALV